VELRSLIEDVVSQCRTVHRDARWPAEGPEARHLEVYVNPLTDRTGRVEAVQVTFADTTEHRRLQAELERSKHDLETAYEELQSSNEELETTNEELQSTNEELETTNEELQSTNEELETMNEELQSTNEELETINSELLHRSDELNHANAFLASILGGLDAGVVVVDPALQVLAWNHRAEDLWGLRADEVQGRHLMTLDIGLPVERLRQPIRALLSGETGQVTLTLDCLNRRGKPIRCGVSGSPLAGGAGDVRGAILMMREVPPAEAAEPGDRAP
jgi:two-component system CheB/CheR fusion protein